MFKRRTFTDEKAYPRASFGGNWVRFRWVHHPGLLCGSQPAGATIDLHIGKPSVNPGRMGKNLVPGSARSLHAVPHPRWSDLSGTRPLGEDLRRLSPRGEAPAQRERGRR